MTIGRRRVPAGPTIAGGLFLLMLSLPRLAGAQGFFLQGEPGSAGDPELACDGATCTLDQDLEVAGRVTAGELEVLTSYWLSACPEGYVQDETETDFVLCTDGLDEMVRVGDVWVDRYEASVWSSADCTDTQYGVADGDWPDTFPQDGQFTEPLYACSTPSVPPSRWITWFQAQAACAAAGKHLITNAEWQTAVTGTVDPGAGSGAGGTCAITWSEPRDAGGGTDCFSYWGAEDMIGNLTEWVAEWLQAGRSWSSGFSDGAIATPWPSSYGDGEDWTRNLDGRAYNWYRGGWTDGIPAAVIRSDGFGINLMDAPVHWAPYIGFRCARSR